MFIAIDEGFVLNTDTLNEIRKTDIKERFIGHDGNTYQKMVYYVYLYTNSRMIEIPFETGNSRDMFYQKLMDRLALVNERE